MKAHYRTETGRLTFELEGNTKDIFNWIAAIQEVFEADTTCGCCGKNRIRFRVRSVEENQFFELICLDCRAALGFGQTKQGGRLYARRKDANGYLPDRGWAVWQPGGADQAEHAERESKPAASAKW